MRTRPDVTRTVELPSGPVTVDEAGYLVEPNDWTEEFAIAVAEQEEIEPQELHWRVIAFMREWLEEHGIMPDARFVLKYLSDLYDVDKEGAKKVLFELFPHGYVGQACKMAGMRQPRAWSTG